MAPPLYALHMHAIWACCTVSWWVYCQACDNVSGGTCTHCEVETVDVGVISAHTFKYDREEITSDERFFVSR